MTSDLVVNFANDDILELPTLFPERQGTVQVTIANQGNESVNEPVTLRLYASTDPNLDSPLNTLDAPLRNTDELLGTVTQDFNLTAGSSQALTLDLASPAFRTASVVSPGASYLIAKVVPNQGIAESNTNNNQDTQFVSVDKTDVVLDWNATFLNATKAAGEGNSFKGIAPPAQARILAIAHTAVYDAVNAFDRIYEPYSVDLYAPSGASVEAAAVGAAYRTAVELFGGDLNLPDQTEIFNQQRDRSLLEIDDSLAAEQAGFNFGVEVANRILALRSNDGAAVAGDIPYTNGQDPGEWVPTSTNGLTTNRSDTNYASAALPDWGSVTPFAIDSVSAFRPDGPPEFGSSEYAAELEEVRLLGSLENSNKSKITRTKDQTEIARFWAYDRDDTFRPPGQYNEITQEIALAQGNTLEENARLFALLNIAQADAGTVTWNTKYAYKQLRPISAIQNAGSDGNPNTIGDPQWQSLLDTPPFPDYISGHSTFGAAAGQVIESFYGTDDISFTIPSQELPGISRQYDRISEFVEENALSRLYGGIHTRSALEDGVEVGRDVANYVVNNILTPEFS
jgi:hypothetical protein